VACHTAQLKPAASPRLSLLVLLFANGDSVSSTVPTLSLVIPSYNRAALIGATIESACNQHLPFLEIIVVDDGSTDHTAEVLARFAGKIRVLKLANGGVQNARNAGVAAASGDYVVLCDSDDLLEPDYVETISTWLAAHPGYDAVYSNFVTFDERGVHADKFSLAPAGFFEGAGQTDGFWHDIPDLYLRTLSYQPLFPSGSVIHKAFYQRIGGYDVRFNGVGGEDWEFTLRLIGQGRLALCATPLVRIRKHGANDSADNIRTVSGCVHILEFVLNEHPFSKPYRDAILRSIDERRLDVFNGAFARGTFDVATDMLSRMRSRPQDRKFRLKATITAMPGLLRRPLWRLTQMA
jgi:glycosyltransferase involved in cell wall biosynthesis